MSETSWEQTYKYIQCDRSRAINKCEKMNWKKLFTENILERGYDYYCENAVEISDISADVIKAEVAGKRDYKVKIFINDGEISDMRCSCPYAADGNYCKHMAAVLYEWTDYSKDDVDEDDIDISLGLSSVDKYQKKYAEISKLVEQADINVVRPYLSSVLTENEKLLFRFQNMVKKIQQKMILNYI